MATFYTKKSRDVNESGALSDGRPLETGDILNGPADEVRRFKVTHLSERYKDGSKNLPNPLKDLHPEARYLAEDWCTQSFITSTRITPGDKKGTGQELFQCLRAGQREKIYWDPSKVNAAIVNCGGLCPGLNSVIREVTMMLNLYGVNKIYGIIGGYKGVMEPENWIELTPDVVQDIHVKGGSFLVSDRGNPKHYQMAEKLREYNIRHLFIIGGDGTHKGATTIYEEASAIPGVHTIPGKALDPPYECSVVGIPKTIDNDIALMDFTFGFHSAVAEAVRAIDAAYVESSGNANCLGLVKLMGRSSGFIAMTATLAARHVDLCLIPEMSIDMTKVLDYIVDLQKTKHNAVVVIAEGLGDTLIKGEGVDAGGNKKLADVGPWFKSQVEDHFKKLELPLSIKYIDPSYQVRAVPPDAFDSVYCAVLAQNAVHGAMAGYTGFTVGRIDNLYVMLPIQAITERQSKTVNVHGKEFGTMVHSTKQPRMVPDEVPEDHPEPPPPRVDKPYLSAPLTIKDMFPPKDVVVRCELQHLSTRKAGDNVESPFAHPEGHHDVQVWKDENAFACAGPWIHSEEAEPAEHLQFLRGGPRKTCYWDPKKTKAAIVNCGGLCPGLNSVIRELVMMLDQYGCKDIFGIIGGYKGVMEPDNWMKLTPKVVEEWHLKGGSCLVSDRGNPPHLEMAKMYQKHGINQVYIIGGDGTAKGAMQTYEQMLGPRPGTGWKGCDLMKAIDHNCSMCSIPKTIDNDIALLDFTFGFHTAVAKAVESIDTAYTEATCNANCMGLVKLMGRHAGFIAMYATISARHVDLCLIPEMETDMEAVKAYIAEKMAKQKYCVVVIAEGLGDTLIQGGGHDAGGNKTLADVGPWFKKQVEAHMKKLNQPFTCKYIDPSYIIRAAPPDSFDSVYCSNLAQTAVHGCFAGYTGFCVGKFSNHYVMLPIDEITGRKSKTVNTKGRWFSRLMYTTKQPTLKAGPKTAEQKEKEAVWDVFRQWDKSGSGKIKAEELVTVLTKIGLNKELIQVLLNKNPKGDSGEFDFEELTTWIFEQAAM